MLRKNVSGQFLYFAGINASTGAALTGATFSVRRCIDGTFAAGGGTITEDTGLGLYKCALTQADTNGNDLAFFFTATSAIPVCINVLTTAADPSDSVRFGLTALPNAAAGANGGLPLGDASGRVDLGKVLGTASAGAVGYVGVDWGAVTNKTTANALTGTTIATTQKVDVETIKTQAVTCAAGVTVLASVGTAATSTAQTGDAYARLGAPAGASVSVDIAAVKTDTAAVKVQTDKLTFTVANVLDANTLRIGGTVQSAWDLGANRAEPAQGAPGATISYASKIDYLYKAWRNKKTQTASQTSIYADDTTTVDHKMSVSDDGTTATVGEVATGP